MLLLKKTKYISVLLIKKSGRSVLLRGAIVSGDVPFIGPEEVREGQVGEIYGRRGGGEEGEWGGSSSDKSLSCPLHLDVLSSRFRQSELAGDLHSSSVPSSRGSCLFR
ncbi:hypothetical protein RRG08_054422 [Elysia crispata]|uniref:Uncharacterized protein n=1 Tax=Elysia crispata TaxID=231223 RepID=A0AAE1AVM1_9GAST|nr:hypothetical protein RRG08_054422 [Elysia crispata]